MENDIINLLNIPDEDVLVIKTEIEHLTKFIHLQKKLSVQFCPECSSRMYSKGIYKRTVNHPVFQDGYKLILILHQRRWMCSNEECKCTFNDSFSFVEKYKHSSVITPFLILDALKDINTTATVVANRFNVSDTYVHYTFLKYVNLSRLPFSKVISIDEVFLEFNHFNRYALVIMDFTSGQIIDILPNRLKDTVHNYFMSIPKAERDAVEFIICDMYNPYINYTKNYFTNAKAVVDSFHVIQWINRKIISYIKHVKNKYQERDRKELQNENLQRNRIFQSKKDSKEVYLLKNYKWFLLKNHQDIQYESQRKLNRRLNMYLDTYQLEEMFMSLDKNFLKIRELKDLYISFNQRPLDEHIEFRI